MTSIKSVNEFKRKYFSRAYKKEKEEYPENPEELGRVLAEKHLNVLKKELNK